MAATPARRRRIGGWGYADEEMQPSAELMAWLGAEVGPPGPPIRGEAIAPPAAPPRPIGALPVACSTDAMDRLAHARGQALPDVVTLRGGLLAAAPDAVCRPADASEIEAVLRQCARDGIHVVPWGGGTSVTGGVNVVAGDAPVLTLDLERLGGMVEADPESGLATFGAGTAGPEVERALAAHGLTLGHFPQSWELSTIGGWVATRSAGQQSLGYGRIEDMTAGLELVAPSGRLALPALPASASGPDLRQLVLGSEGRLGVITQVTVRARPRPPASVVEGALLPSFEVGVRLLRALMIAGVPLDLLRLSDGSETRATLASASAGAAARLLRLYLSLRGVGPEACLLIYGASGTRPHARAVIAEARAALRAHHAVLLGSRPGRSWVRDRFRRPYLREALLDRGYATDTVETAVPWSRVADAWRSIGGAIAGALAGSGERLPVLCHVSHTYLDGASLYFTFFFRTSQARETLARWAAVKRAATAAIVAARGAVSHHHGIGQWHAAAYGSEVGEMGRALVAAAARHLDPRGTLNPHVLLDTRDHLEA